MKKIITIVLVVLLIASMAISANAAGNVVPIGKVGITFKMPSIVVPDIPRSVHERITTTIPSNFMDNWLKAHRDEIYHGHS